MNQPPKKLRTREKFGKVAAFKNKNVRNVQVEDARWPDGTQENAKHVFGKNTGEQVKYKSKTLTPDGRITKTKVRYPKAK